MRGCRVYEIIVKTFGKYLISIGEQISIFKTALDGTRLLLGSQRLQRRHEDFYYNPYSWLLERLRMITFVEGVHTKLARYEVLNGGHCRLLYFRS